MTRLDALIIAAVVLAAVAGFRRGFLVGALSLGGFAAGVLLAVEFGPQLVDTRRTTSVPALLALVAGFVGSVVAVGVGRWLLGGLTARRRPRRGGAARTITQLPVAFDRVLGALLSAGVALGVAWLAGAAALQPAAPLAVREAIRESTVLTRLNAALPPADPILAALPRFDAIPRLPGPRAEVAAPARGIARDPDIRAAAASVVRVVGAACGEGMSGSGWVAAPGLVVTNAHVIAGQDETRVQPGGEGDLIPAVAVAVDRRNDIAVLRVDGLDAPALRMAGEIESAAPVAMLGFPGNGPYRARPARLGASSRLLIGDGSASVPTPRSVRSFRAPVRPGNSGGPLVDASGRVTATVFAARNERRSRTGFAVPNGPVRRALTGADQAVSTGPCRAGAR